MPCNRAQTIRREGIFFFFASPQGRLEVSEGAAANAETAELRGGLVSVEDQPGKCRDLVT